MSEIIQWNLKHTATKFKLDSLYKNIMDANRLESSQPSTFTLILGKLEYIKVEIDALEHSPILLETTQ